MANGRGIIAFMSDFGLRDPYVGIVHGVIERLGHGSVKVIDITHEIPSFSTMAGAYVLFSSYRWFPQGTVFLVVVDPGVGSARRPLVIKTANYFFVGPDNGVLWPAASDDSIVEARIIENEEFFLKPVSRSFHGRDVFAPIAVYLALGGDLSRVGRKAEIESLVKTSIFSPCIALEEGYKASVVYVDRFGNVALSFRGYECWEKICRAGRGVVRVIRGNSSHVARCLEVFSLARPGELVLYVNSLGFLELAVNLGDASKRIKVGVGDTVMLSPGDKRGSE